LIGNCSPDDNFHAPGDQFDLKHSFNAATLNDVGV
jgi:hypothetical protein